MSYLSDATKAQLIANPASIGPLYNTLWSTFARDLGGADQNMTLSNQLLASAFASICAWSLKPYGNEDGPNDLASILAKPTLACDNYVMLTLHLMRLIPQTAGVTIAAVGWDNGPVGNHAQLFVSDGTETLLLDPTIGLVLRGSSYNDVTAGRPCDPNQLRSFYGQFGGDPICASLNRAVIAALSNGGYRPSHALYYYATLALMIAPAAEMFWPTPAASRLHPA